MRREHLRVTLSCAFGGWLGAYTGLFLSPGSALAFIVGAFVGGFCGCIVYDVKAVSCLIKNIARIVSEITQRGKTELCSERQPIVVATDKLGLGVGSAIVLLIVAGSVLADIAGVSHIGFAWLILSLSGAGAFAIMVLITGMIIDSHFPLDIERRLEHRVNSILLTLPNFLKAGLFYARMTFYVLVLLAFLGVTSILSLIVIFLSYCATLIAMGIGMIVYQPIKIAASDLRAITFLGSAIGAIAGIAYESPVIGMIAGGSIGFTLYFVARPLPMFDSKKIENAVNSTQNKFWQLFASFHGSLWVGSFYHKFPVPEH
ncbi:MAG: hypothetical protein A3H01_00845 [Candidatus Wildermuthbacteria bacterium RIFCSPLOWO2_12_FULL_40_9]|uniref:Uncharacterized protein n=1 Tax=Candidatus Wildermuthbacteria bacterium RIFCSPLOWO2_12_FULL_40_9 TaxID=1802467 RepID=A0A1G2RWL5_9BACT|nr:MAG: hypothetical protein A3H01_00845 [Candidatus Wildermuthbacteria bacterium RIFCSPLOWO2_12_FULL_40_9]